MMQPDRRIPIDIAHQVLAIFGITEPSPLYDRRVKADGFAPGDLHEILALESRFIFGVDWRAVLPDELAPIAAAVAELGATLQIAVPDDADDGFVSCDGRSEYVKYVPSDCDDFTVVIAAVQRVVPSVIEFRASPSNAYQDGWEFAALLQEEWAALESLDHLLIAEMFEPLPHRQGTSPRASFRSGTCTSIIARCLWSAAGRRLRASSDAA